MKAIYSVKRGCTLCGTCLYECPVKAIRMTASGAVIDQDKCIGCGRCYKNCASEAIERLVSPEENTADSGKKMNQTD